MFRLFDRFIFTLERIKQHRALVLWTLAGLIAAAALALSLTLYVDAVNTRLLETRLGSPPYAFRYRYLGSWNGNIDRARVETADNAIIERLAALLGMPTAEAARYLSAGVWSVGLVNDGATLPMGTYTLGALEGADAKIAVVTGERRTSPYEDGALPVIVPESLFYTTGLQVGDTLTATRPGGLTAMLRISGLWRPVDANDPAWIFTPRYFENAMLIDTANLWTIIEGVERPIEEAAWMMVFDGSDVKTSDVGGLLARMADADREIAAALPGIRPDLSPAENLRAFNAETQRLTQQLVIMSLPVGGLVLYFVALVSGLLVSRQGAEDAVLRSRGMSRAGVLALHAGLWGLLAAAAFGAAVVISPLIVQIVGQTSSFLRFDANDAPLTVVYSGAALGAGAVTVLIAAGSGLLLSWRSGRQTVTSFRRAGARAGRAWWQRTYLDLLLFIPAVYVLYTLWQSGGLVASAADPFSDPLAFMGPTLFAFSLTLIFLRLWAALLRVGEGVVTFGRAIPPLMALRELTRSAARYRGTLLMMGFTLSLTGFTASMASTLDKSLQDTIDYSIGADAVIVTAPDATTETTQADSGQTQTTITGFNTLPAEDLLTIPGVTNVSRVGRYAGQIVLPNQRLQGTILGIDRAAIAAVTRARPDYGDTPLADLFNRLAGNRTGAIISAKTAREQNLRVGQTISIQISALNNWYSIDVPIVGTVEYFPTLNPANGFFLLMALDVVFETVGSELPHDLWLSLAPDADTAAVQHEAVALGFPILEWRSPAEQFRAALAAPLRRGVLGFLSVGFVASIGLTLVAAIIQSTAAFRAQAAQLGSLRAMGLGALSVALYLLLVQGLSAMGGIAGGTLIGVATTLLYLPVLDFSTGLPPYLVRVAWNDIALVYAAFAGVLLVVTAITTFVMGRESLSALVKLGD